MGVVLGYFRVKILHKFKNYGENCVHCRPLENRTIVDFSSGDIEYE